MDAAMEGAMDELPEGLAEGLATRREEATSEVNMRAHVLGFLTRKRFRLWASFKRRYERRAGLASIAPWRLPLAHADGNADG
jgi:hypothetical protein